MTANIGLSGVASDRRPPYFVELEAIYTALDHEVAGHAPVCELSGRCCRFREFGHTLFLSEPEMDYLVHEAPPPVRAIDDGATCPWQDQAGRCTARQARPLGCRVYYCDPGYQDVAPGLSEHYLTQLKQLTVRHDLQWNYAPLHRHLHERGERMISRLGGGS